MNYSLVQEISPAAHKTSGKLTSLLKKYNGNLEVKNTLIDSFAKVERAKQEWESTVDSLPELICVVDENDRIIRANQTVKTWGLGSVTNIQGHDFHSLIHPVCAKPCPLETFLQQTKQESGQNSIVESEIYDPLLQRFIQMRSKPILMKKDTAETYRVIILHDISQRKEMEEALHRQNGRLTALNAINQTILSASSPEEVAQATLTHLQSLITFQQAHIMLNLPQTHELCVLATANEGTSNFIQSGQKLSHTEFAGQDHYALNHFFLIEQISELTNPTSIERHWQRQNIQSYANFPLVMGANLIGVLQLATNDPPTFKPEHIIIAMEVSETLTIAINQSQLYQKLEQGNKNLQELLRAKHEMIQNVSHDLRSPLALIKGYTELLQEGILGDLSTEQRDALTILETTGDQMFFLINRLLKLQTIDKHALNKETINPADFLEKVAKSWQVLTTNKSIRLHVDVQPNLPTLMGDLDMLNQVIFNLLDNALKFSSQGSTITISAQSQNEAIIFAVIDEGKGIPPDQIEFIFDRFYQVGKGSAQSRKGAGIGLALCKKITEVHDGRIWAESKGDGQGSSFFFSLPITN